MEKKSTNSSDTMNLKSDKYREKHTEAHHSQIAENLKKIIK